MLSTLLLTCLAAASPGAPTAAVLSFEVAGNVGTALTQAVNDSMVQLLRNSGAFSAVHSQKDMETLLGLDKTTQLATCDSTGCMAELAGALGADFVVTGSIKKVGASHIVTARLLDAKKAAVTASEEFRVRGDNEEGVLDLLPLVAWQLLTNGGLTHALKRPAPPPAEAAQPLAASPAVATPPLLPVPAAPAGDPQEAEGGHRWGFLGLAGLGAAGLVGSVVVAAAAGVATYLGVGIAYALSTGDRSIMADAVGGVGSAVGVAVPLLLLGGGSLAVMALGFFLF